jgi:hypothetical protein
MATKRQQWSPDTCACVVEQFHDPDAGVGTSLSKFVVKCPIHAALPDAAAWAAVHEENQGKNIAVGLVVSKHGLPLDEIGWGFDAARNVVISVPSLNVAQKAALVTSMATVSLSSTKTGKIKPVSFI